MCKKQIIRKFRNLMGIEEKEDFVRRHGIKFTYDSFYRMIIFAEDGTLQLYPVRR